MDETRENFRNQEAATRNLEIQVGQIAKQLNKRPPNTFPSDTIPNPKEECKVMLGFANPRSRQVYRIVS
ncbi:hypothetical protein PIB30_071132, partial [Stylosanthes scabra]|nr:hypothetical protein [Stylosanthes scabra]